MKNRFIISLLVVLSLSAYGQTEAVNQLDSAGKKHGKWIRYLDTYWKAVNDSSQAVYYRYTFYDHGLNIHPMGAGGGKGWKMESSVDTSKQKGIKILDGEYKWYDEKGRLLYIHILKDGEYVSYKEFYKTGELRIFFDYTKKCEGQPHSWHGYSYNKRGVVKMTMYTCKDKNGRWPVMRG